MADKILQTRIINKHADLATWKDSTLPLKTGEIALARVETTKPDGNGGHYTVPTYLMKIGDGEKTFSQLEWLAAPASDVYEWAKASVKPTYKAEEIALKSGSAVEDAIVALQTAVGGSGSVSTMIQTAIQALDENTWAAEDGIKFVTAIGETDGKISVTRRALTAADIPALGIDKITGLQAALDLKATKNELEEAVTGINTTINGTVAQNIAAAKKAGEDAQKTIDDYKTANDAALAGVKATAEAATTVSEAEGIAAAAVSKFKTENFDSVAERVGVNETDINNLETALAKLAGEGNTSTVKANADAIAKLAQDIGNVANVMNFRGVSVKGEGTTPGHDITDPQNGDVIIYGESEYVYDGSKWVKFGDASDNATAISDLQDRVGAIETDLDDTGWVKTSIDAAQEQADKGVADAKTANDAIAVIKGTGDGSISKAVEDATTALQNYADGKASAAETAAKGYTDTEVAKASDAASAAQTAIDTHAGKTDNPHNVTKTQVGLGNVENKSTATIKSEFTGSIAADNEGFVIGGAVYTAINDAKTAVNGYTDTEVKKVADKADANATDIGAIQDTYARVSGDKLVVGQGADEMVIIFDCGGAN